MVLNAQFYWDDSEIYSHGSSQNELIQGENLKPGVKKLENVWLNINHHDTVAV